MKHHLLVYSCFQPQLNNLELFERGFTVTVGGMDGGGGGQGMWLQRVWGWVGWGGCLFECVEVEWRNSVCGRVISEMAGR